MIDPSASLGSLVSERPTRATMFERLRLDYCCGGGQSLAEACEQRGLDADTVCQMLEALDEPLTDQRHADGRDWRQVPIPDLCDHIVTAHHDRLRAELPRIDELLATVVRVHGTGHPELHDLRRLFGTMRVELESHMESEERVVFPACRAADADQRAVGEDVLASHEHEHTETGDGLAALRELGQDYDTSRALCGTHRRLLQSLHELELDLHQHIHEENNILFPRVRALNETGGSRSR